jgi:hypothetical protein
MFVTIAISLSIFLWYSRYVVPWNEQRRELVEIPDPLFRYLPILDTSRAINFILYTVFIHAVWNGIDTLSFCWTFSLLMIMRSMVLYLHPFKGHHTMKPLRDPLVEWFLGKSKPLLHDCSFSGHVSTLVALGLLAERPLYHVAAAVTGVLLILSRVHYGADCAIAPFFAYLSYEWWPLAYYMSWSCGPWTLMGLCGFFLVPTLVWQWDEYILRHEVT